MRGNEEELHEGMRGRSRHNKQAVNSISRDCGRRRGRAPASGKRDSRIAYVDKMNGRARARDLDGRRRGEMGKGRGVSSVRGGADMFAGTSMQPLVLVAVVIARRTANGQV